METNTHTARIDIDHVPYIRAKIATLNKRAAKLNVPGFSLTVLGTKIEKSIVWADIEITGATIRKAGWEFLATLDHLPEGNVIRKVPGVETDLSPYREALAMCEHCNTLRARRSTYVIQHKSGELRQVGRNCLRDFMGHNLHSLVPVVEMWSECLEGAGSGSGPVHLESWLAYCFAAIRLEGGEYVSRKKAGESNRHATADIAALLAEKSRKDGKTYRTTEDFENASRAIWHVRETLGARGPLSDYEHNLLLSVRSEFIEPRHKGFAASAASLYLRSLARVENEPAPSEYIGQLKKRLEFDGTVEFITYYETMYGWQGIFKIRVGTDVVVWKTSKDLDWGLGDRVRFKGTIKAHEEYRGERQTVVSRCTVLEHIDRLEVS